MERLHSIVSTSTILVNDIKNSLWHTLDEVVWNVSSEHSQP